MHSTIALGSLRTKDAEESRKARAAERTAIAVGGILSLLGLAGWLMPLAVPEWFFLPPTAAAAGLTSAIGLGFSKSRRRGARAICLAMAAATGLLALTALILGRAGMPGPLGALGRGLPPQIAGAFLLLSFVLLFLRANKGARAIAADVSMFGMGWSVLTLVFDGLFSALRIFGVSLPAKPAMVWMMALLAFAAISRRTEYGAFSKLRTGGLTGRLIHILFWITLVLPFLRETMRARLMQSRLMPEHSASASLAATAVTLGMVFLLLIGHYFRRLENEIREMSLRDELTGLYNLRGFRLLAGQALRLAQRSDQPFCLMFVDVDDLKQVNDEHGHAVGSLLLVETAELLQSTFRETDVVGRIGGDEFVVAGQFGREAIERFAGRLAANSAANRGTQRPYASLSLGHVTADRERRQSLEDLLALADDAMYQQKRSKKRQITV